MYFDCKIAVFPNIMAETVIEKHKYAERRYYIMQIDVESYYRRYGPMVLRRCRSLLKDEEQAMDAMQEVFVKLMESKDRLTGEYPSSLLYTMATNLCLNRIRSDSRQAGTGVDELLYSIAVYDDTEERLFAGDILDRIFRREPASTRDIAVLFYVDGMTLREVADTVGLSVSGVRKRLRTLKERVAALKEENYEAL
jgi:RNA polymerase sigma-70 factor (ECF subfamily)